MSSLSFSSSLSNLLSKVSKPSNDAKKGKEKVESSSSQLPLPIPLSSSSSSSPSLPVTSHSSQTKIKSKSSSPSPSPLQILEQQYKKQNEKSSFPFSSLSSSSSPPSSLSRPRLLQKRRITSVRDIPHVEFPSSHLSEKHFVKLSTRGVVAIFNSQMKFKKAKKEEETMEANRAAEAVTRHLTQHMDNSNSINRFSSSAATSPSLLHAEHNKIFSSQNGIDHINNMDIKVKTEDTVASSSSSSSSSSSAPTASSRWSALSDDFSFLTEDNENEEETDAQKRKKYARNRK